MSQGNVTNVSCFGGNDGSLSVNASGATAPYQYSIDGGTTWQTSNTFNTLTAGTYNIDIKDNNNCSDNVNITITEPTILVVSQGTVTNVSCFGGNDGSLSVNASGATAPYQYSIDGGTTWQNSNTFNTLTAGTYTIDIKDNNNCSDNINITITEPNQVNISTSFTEPSCHGGSNGSISLNVSGATAPYQYSIDGGITWQTSNTFNALTGTYTIQIEDDNGCSYSTSETITQPTQINITTSFNEPSCFGFSDGAISLNVSGATAPYQYSIDGGITWQTSNTFNALAAGTYTIQIEDNNGCSYSASETITQPTILVVSQGNVTNVSCFGGNDGSLSVNASGATAPYQYSIDGGTTWQTSNTFNTLTAGTYNIDIKDNNNCSDNVNITITEPTILVVSQGTVTNVSCFGGNDGSLSVNASGATAPYQYSIDGGTTWQNSNTFNTLTAGTYTIDIKDNNNCSDNINITITEPNQVNISTSFTEPSCHGGSNGSISLNVSGATAPYQYSIDGGITWQTSNTFNALAAGTYTIQIEDDNGCSYNTSETITQPTQINITTSFNEPSCFGFSDGAISLNVSGATAPYQYSIDGGITWQTSNTFNALTAGTYTIQIEDNNGCSYSASETITQPTILVVSQGNVTNVSCFGGNDGSLSVNASGATAPYQYRIAGPGGVWQNSNTFNGLIAGTYTIVIQDNNSCSQSIGITITEPTILVVSQGTVTNVSCFGGNDGSLSVNASGATAPYQYSIDGGTTWQNSNTFNTLTAGTYTIDIKDNNNCSDNINITITEPNQVNISTSFTEPSCHGGSNGSISLNVSGATAPYQYSIDGGITWQTSNTFNALAAGTYTIQIEDDNGCSYSTSETITQPTQINITTSFNEPSCFGFSDGAISLNVSGATAPYQYSIDGGITWQTSNTFNALTAGTYTIQIEDNNGCSYSASETITQPTILVVSQGNVTNVSCFGGNDGSLSVNASGATAPYQYRIAGPSGVWQNSNTFNGLIAGTYTIVIQDNNSCSQSIGITITEPTILVVSQGTVTNVSCFGGNDGSLSVNASGATAPYQYSIDGGTTWQNSNTFNTLTAGTYTIDIKDNNNCSDNINITITEPNQVNISTSFTEPSCHGGSNGSISLNVSGATAPYQYSIDGGNTWQTSNTFNALAAGTYTIQIEDANGCNYSASETITQPTQINITTSFNEPSCFGFSDGAISLNVSGATAPYQYSIDGGITWQTSNTFNALAAGTYTIQIEDNNGCSYSASETITQPTILVVSQGNVTNVSCFGGNDGSLSVNASGATAPYQYSIDGGTTWQTSNTFNTLTAGTYNIDIKDNNNCSDNVNITITEPTILVVSQGTVTNVSCFGGNDGSLSVNASGATAPYQYSIDGGTTWQNSNTFNTLTAGTYTIDIKDNNNCSDNINITITEPNQVNISTSFTEPSCHGGSNGSISLNVSGATAPYQYSIDGGITWQTSNTFNALATGTYTIQIEDDNGCSYSTSETITQPTQINITTSFNEPSCFGFSDGAISLNVSGATAPYQYSIDGGITWQTSNTFNALTAGTYTIQIEDNNGCSYSASETITQPTILVVSQGNVTNVSCFGGNDGSLSVNASGATAPYQYSIDGGTTWQTSNTFNTLTAGTYNIDIKDNNNCSDNVNITITEPTILVVSQGTVTNVSCFGGNDGSLSVNASGATAPYQYSIDGGNTWQNSNTFNTLTAGTYTIDIKDNNNCSDNINITITEPNQVNISTSFTEPSCHGGSNGSISLNVSGATAPYQYSIDGGITWQTSNTFNALACWYIHNTNRR